MTDVPQTPTPIEPPVTFRDLVALAVMVGIGGRESPSRGAAQRAWRWADAVIAEREVRS